MIATARIHVLRGTYVDELGDEVDAWDLDAEDEAQRPEVVTPAGGIAASLIERSRVVFDPATGEARTVQLATCRIAALVEVRSGDRILDLATGDRYGVSGRPTTQRSLTGGRTVRFDVKRTSGE